MTTKVWVTEDEEGLEIEVHIPCEWVICDSCQGEGRSSSYLGAITSSEWEHDWDQDERETYLSGGYDRQCEDCGGSGKIKEVDWVSFEKDQPEMAKAYQEDLRWESEDRAYSDMERRFCGG